MATLELKLENCPHEVVAEIDKVIKKYKEREEKNIKDAEEYVRRAKFIIELVDRLIDEKPHLKSSFIDWYMDTNGKKFYKEVKVSWNLIDWINVFPDNAARVEFLLYPGIFELIVSKIGAEFIQATKEPKHTDFSIKESIELLRQFKKKL